METVNRRGTSSLKWDLFGDDILPLWVADMDFKSPPAVLEMLREKLDHGVLGYTLAPDELYEAVISWCRAQYGWQIERDWIIWLPGVVTGLNLSCRTVCGPEHEAITATPIYPPFLKAPELSGCKLKSFELTERGGRYHFDLERFESVITEQSRLLMLCSPHNPVGRVFSRDELSEIAELCEQHDMVICSDEIHCDLILDKALRHVPTASLSEEIAERTITLMAPSKTFNIPGMACSFAIISNSALRSRFEHTMHGIVPHVNALGYWAALAAYRDSEDWRQEMLEYLRGNLELVKEFAARHSIMMPEVEATYLAWLDTRHIEGATSKFLNAGVALSDGGDFGAPGFVRINFGCSRELLQEALIKMESAL